MNFDKAIWKAKLKFNNLRQKATVWGVDSIYSLCIAATLWPALDALFSGDPFLAMEVGAAIGSDLIKGHLKALRGIPKEQQVPYLQEAVEENPDLRQDVEDLMGELSALTIALNQNAADRDWLEEKLNAELAQWGQTIEVEDRSINVQGDINSSIANTGDNPVFHVTIVKKQEKLDTLTDPLTLDRAQGEAARQDYLQQLYCHCQDLSLDIFGEADTQAARVKLDDVYIELFTTTLKDPEKIKEEEEGLINNRLKEENRLSAWEAAQRSNHLVFLGDPGSGKSSFAKRLLGRLCQVELGELSPLEGFPMGLTPVLVNLRDLVPALQKDTLPETTRTRKRALQDLILKQVAQDVKSEHRTPGFEEGIRQALLRGECFLVLDGFDEVPQALRGVVREAVGAILSFNPQRVLVTCRIRSYTGEAVLSGFNAHTLAPLEKPQIEKFCQDWYRRQSELKRVLVKDFEDKAEDFFQAAISDEKLQELAENPMLLTTMAIVHQKNTRLPPERVKLFKEVVIILLFNWQGHHGNEHLKESLRLLLADEGKLLRAVKHLAYAAHQAGQDEKEEKEAADLPRKLARDILEDHHVESAQVAEDFLDYIDERSGILIGRGGELGKPHTYAFPHRFIQEYLAGCHLASKENPYTMTDQFRALAEEGDFWDEAALLAFEELKHNRTSLALWFLADELVKDCDLENPCHQRQVMWSGQIANLIGRKTLEQGGRRGSRYLGTLESKLLTAAQGTLLNPAERAEAADALDGLGYISEDLYSFVEIPGDDKVSTFWIGKYPITNRQYARFLTPENFSNPKLWIDLPDLDAKGQQQGTLGEEGWRWLEDEINGKDVLKPRYWDSLRFGQNRSCAPVVGISWYEAMAYARWVQRQWDQLQEVDQNQAVKPGLIRLPVEVEWEKAAGGIADDRYACDRPGETTDREKLTKYANTDESGIGRSTPVWTYPQGKSHPYGLFDMTGNVWEWGANRYSSESGPRVVRGGSFLINHVTARCAFRYRLSPDFWDFNIGFRLCLRP
jgi:formylglycine-generating enzyme required for sulfatase activity